MGNWSSRGIQDILELEKAYILRNQLEDYQSHHTASARMLLVVLRKQE